MDRIFIRNLEISAIIGIHEAERHQPQRVVLDLEMASDISRAASTEDIALALDYQKVSQRLSEFVGASEYQLVETLAEQIASLLREEFGVPWLRLTLHKPDALPGTTDVGVIIERGHQ